MANTIPPVPPYSLPTRADLPENTVSWTVDPRRALLLVHDMQHYFLRCFGDRSPGPELLAHATAVRRAAAVAGVPVAYTAQPGSMTPAERGLLKDFWGEGMRATAADRDIPASLAPAPGDTVFTKWRPSAFFRTGLLDLLRDSGRDQLILCGVYAHVGLLQTACEAMAHDIQPFFVADAVADFSERDHRMAVEYAAKRCAMVVTTADVCDALALQTTGALR
ncbi:phenazine biosynthesis protein PhzD [Streptomyces sp. Y2F8-2]|uniref:isochorismatase family protein n=1 Tax=unclassified Streptomyces TaxID=2593676 RepID=UPI00190754EF|nr:isochorismatase family protein [Streptomyces sp. Y2F8-2]GHJ98969.1 phenazine biosynthesis protein PhzD [Streptomyces sp. Y2F8-2]